MPSRLWYNRRVLTRHRVLAAALMLTGGLAACAPAAADTIPTASATLVAYRTRTATPTPSRPTATLPPIVTPGPSPTPLAHVVQANDTLVGIALEYGVSLEHLLAANPGINPRFLSIGQAILIPGPEGQPVAALAPTPTPMAVVVAPARCYRTLSGSLWCLTAVHNSLEAPVEGAAVLITLLDEEGVVLDSQVAHTPLRLIPPGGELPLAAFFAAPAPRPASTAVMLLSALSASAESHTLPVSVRKSVDQPGEDRRSWRVAGEVVLDSEAGAAAGRGGLVLVGYDAEGAVAGLAAWDWEDDLAPGAAVSFDLTLFSLGPQLERVTVWAEALAAE
ncbi:MAG: LysM domain-containing protein [Chloroflexota bacterium]